MTDLLRSLLAILALAAAFGPTAAHAQTVPVRVVAEGSTRHTLHRVVLEGPRSRWTGRAADVFEPLCTAPCALQLPLGTYRFGISSDGGDAQRAARLVDLFGPSTLVLEHDDRSGLRAAGWTTFGVFALAAAGLALSMLAVDTSQPGYEGPLYGLAGAAIGTVVLGGVIAIPLVGFQDHVEVEVRPGL